MSKRKERELVELVVLVLEVFILIIKLKVSPEEATRTTAQKHHVAFEKLWEALPKKWR